MLVWGSAEDTAKRCAEHHDAGADHVCIQVINADATVLARPQWRELAPAVLS